MSVSRLDCRKLVCKRNYYSLTGQFSSFPWFSQVQGRSWFSHNENHFFMSCGQRSATNWLWRLLLQTKERKMDQRSCTEVNCTIERTSIPPVLLYCSSLPVGKNDCRTQSHNVRCFVCTLQCPLSSDYSLANKKSNSKKSSSKPQKRFFPYHRAYVHTIPKIHILSEDRAKRDPTSEFNNSK